MLGKFSFNLCCLLKFRVFGRYDVPRCLRAEPTLDLLAGTSWFGETIGNLHETLRADPARLNHRLVKGLGGLYRTNWVQIHCRLCQQLFSFIQGRIFIDLCRDLRAHVLLLNGRRWSCQILIGQPNARICVSHCLNGALIRPCHFFLLVLIVHRLVAIRHMGNLAVFRRVSSLWTCGQESLRFECGAVLF